MKGMSKIVVLLVSCMFAISAFAKDAAPMAADPVLEKLVNEISAELRCLVCQNQTIADSHAELAVDLKNQVRDMVGQGKSQEEIVDYMVKRYGDFVRYRPPVKNTTVLLWVGPFILLLVGLTVLVLNLRKRRAVMTDTPLSADEDQRIKELLSGTNKQQEQTETRGEDKSS